VSDDGNNLTGLLTDLIKRVEERELRKKEISDDIKLVYAEAKANGLDVKILREIIRQRKIDPSVRQEIEDLIETYKTALGMK
jgi:uncharacterized protein (UPF0335 family)